MADDVLVKSVIVIILCIAIIISNILSILVLLTVIKDPDEVQGIDYYLLSLAVTDTMYGAIVAPFSIHSIVLGDWVLGSFVCHVIGYLTITLWCVDVLTFLWMSVDRYLFIRLAHKYMTGHWKTKCKCWIGITWITATFFCLPPFIAVRTSTFVEHASICLMDWEMVRAYYITISILAIGPIFIITIHNYGYLLFMRISIIQAKNLPYRKYSMSLIENVQDSSHNVSLALLMIFWLSWLPFLVLNFIERFALVAGDLEYLKFPLIWIGFSSSAWKIIILNFLSHKYKRALMFIFNKNDEIINVMCHEPSGCATEPHNHGYVRHISRFNIESLDDIL